MRAKLENVSSRLDMYTRDCRGPFTKLAFDYSMTLFFDLFISRSTQAEDQSRTIYLPTLVLIAQAVFLLQHGLPYRQSYRRMHYNYDTRHYYKNKWSKNFDERPH